MSSVQDRGAEKILIHTKMWYQDVLNCEEVFTLLDSQKRDEEKQWVPSPHLAADEIGMDAGNPRLRGKHLCYTETACKERVSSLPLNFASSEE